MKRKILVIFYIIIFSIFTHIVITKAENTSNINEIIEISGIVKDEAGNPLKDVKIFYNDDTNPIAITDESGRYWFWTEKGNGQIRYNIEGYEYSANTANEKTYSAGNKLSSLEKLKFIYLDKYNNEQEKLQLAGRIKHIISKTNLQYELYTKNNIEDWIQELSEQSKEGKGLTTTVKTIGFGEISEEDKDIFLSQLDSRHILSKGFDIYAKTVDSITEASTNGFTNIVFTTPQDWKTLIDTFIWYEMEINENAKTIEFTDGVANIQAQTDLIINPILKQTETPVNPEPDENPRTSTIASRI